TLDLGRSGARHIELVILAGAGWRIRREQLPEEADHCRLFPLFASQGPVLTASLLQPLESMGVAQRLGGQIRHDLTELQVAGREARPVAEGPQEDRAD